MCVREKLHAGRDVCERLSATKLWVTKLCVERDVCEKVVCERVVFDKVACDKVARPATSNEGRCRQVPHLPRKTKVDVTKNHACHVKRRWMSRSATPATQSGAAPRATNGDQARHQSQPSATSATCATPNAKRR